MKTKLLLHSCCGPCSTAVIEQLYKDYDLTIYFSNSNIFPENEFYKRLESQKIVCEKFNIPLVVDTYNFAEYRQKMQEFAGMPEGSIRCYNCMKFRLERAFDYAQRNNFPLFTTTLSVSPHKNATWINQIGEALQTPETRFLTSNFKKKDGFKRSVELSGALMLYRQTYCGCNLEF